MSLLAQSGKLPLQGNPATPAPPALNGRSCQAILGWPDENEHCLAPAAAGAPMRTGSTMAPDGVGVGKGGRLGICSVSS